MTSNYLGKRFGRWLVLKRGNRLVNRTKCWLCICNCGNIKEVFGSSLLDGTSRSCGCLQIDSNKNRATHRESINKTPEYQSWTSMKNRCFNKNYSRYKDYGGRGITVCWKWKKSYLNFLQDMGRKPSLKHSLDRIDINGGYNPKNCRWATPKEQANNRRNNKKVLNKDI